MQRNLERGVEGEDVFSLKMPRLVARGFAGQDHIRMGCFSCFRESLVNNSSWENWTQVLQPKPRGLQDLLSPLGSSSGSREAVPISPSVGNQQKGLQPWLRAELRFSGRPSVEGRANFRVERLGERQASQLSCCFPDQGRAGFAMSIFGASLSLLTQALRNSQLSPSPGSFLSVAEPWRYVPASLAPFGVYKELTL